MSISVIFASFSLAQPVAPQAVLDRLRSGQSADVIVEFEAESARQQASSMAAAAGRQHHGPSELSYKRAEFARIKAEALAGLAGITTLRHYENLRTSFLRIDSEAALMALLARPGVRAVFENRSASPLVIDTLPSINQPPVAAAGAGGAGTAIGILDTGVDYTRAAFGSCTVGSGSANPPGSPGCRVAATFEATLVDDGVLDDWFIHGTNISGIVAAVAPESKLLVADITTFTPFGPSPSTDAVEAAVDWLIENQTSHNIVAFSFSWRSTSLLGTFTTPCAGGEYEIPFQDALDAGIQPIAASGNDGSVASGMGLAYPACLPSVVSAGAVYDRNDYGEQTPLGGCTDSTTNAGKVACFSQSSPYLSLLAPGVRVSAADVPEQSGTSFAAPHVAGAWAVMRGALPSATHEEILEALQAGGVAVSDSRSFGGTFSRLELFVPDSDNDGVASPLDNCTAVSNPEQQDADGDGCGSRCDGDFDNSGLTLINDFNTFKACFSREEAVGVSGGPDDDPNCLESDMDGSGAMSISDFNDFKLEFASPQTPGPSGLSTAAPGTACAP